MGALILFGLTFLAFTSHVCYVDPLTAGAAYIWVFISQGLTQTFLSSGPQDHQLRESGGPTIILVVLRIKSRHTNSYAYIIKKWVS